MLLVSSYEPARGCIALAHYRVSSSSVVEYPTRSRRVGFFRVCVSPRIYIVSCCYYFSESVFLRSNCIYNFDPPLKRHTQLAWLPTADSFQWQQWPGHPDFAGKEHHVANFIYDFVYFDELLFSSFDCSYYFQWWEVVASSNTVAMAQIERQESGYIQVRTIKIREMRGPGL